MAAPILDPARCVVLLGRDFPSFLPHWLCLTKANALGAGSDQLSLPFPCLPAVTRSAGKSRNAIDVPVGCVVAIAGWYYFGSSCASRERAWTVSWSGISVSSILKGHIDGVFAKSLVFNPVKIFKHPRLLDPWGPRCDYFLEYFFRSILPRRGTSRARFTDGSPAPYILTALLVCVLWSSFAVIWISVGRRRGTFDFPARSGVLLLRRFPGPVDCSCKLLPTPRARIFGFPPSCSFAFAYFYQPRAGPSIATRDLAANRFAFLATPIADPQLARSICSKSHWRVEACGERFERSSIPNEDFRNREPLNNSRRIRLIALKNRESI